MRDPKSPVHADLEIMSGGVVFSGTGVPVWNAIECLEAGESLEKFLEDFATATRDQAVGAPEGAKDALLKHARVA